MGAKIQKIRIFAKFMKTTNTTLFEHIENFIQTSHTKKDRKTGRNLSLRTLKNYKSTQKHLQNFAKQIEKKDFKFSEINQNFYDQFVDYLQSEIITKQRGRSKPKIIKKPFRINTIGKHIQILKTMFFDAETEGICEIPKNFKTVFYTLSEEVDNVYLNEKELEQLKNTDFSETSSLDRVRDWFLLLAWTGCRFSDLSTIIKTDVVQNQNHKFLSFRQRKTNVLVRIPLHPVVVEIFEKYNYKLPKEISNQYFNNALKTVCQKANINAPETLTRTIGRQLVTQKFEKWELVSSHTGRRSFCTNMYKKGLNILTIMAISGHTSEKSFRKYIKIKQEEHSDIVANFFIENYTKNK
jgi:site-specific recombinase XerD